MSRFILIFSIPEKHQYTTEIEGENPGVILELLQFLKLDRLQYEGWHYDRGGDIHNQQEEIESLSQDETWFEVRGEFPAMESDDPQTVFDKLSYALERNKKAFVSNYYEVEYTSKAEGEIPEVTFTKSVVEITLP